MVDRTYRLSSTKELFEVECKELRSIFAKLKYPSKLVDYAISSFITEIQAIECIKETTQ